MFGRVLVALVLTSVGLIAGCSSTQAKVELSGYAPLCVGAYASPVEQAARPVVVVLLHGPEDSRAVERQTVYGVHRYHFNVEPGRYWVRSDEPGTFGAPVTVTAGTPAKLNLISDCR